MVDEWTGSGYDVEAATGGGIILRLTERGQKIRIRICSEPYRHNWTVQQDGQNKQVKRVGWVVLQKELINNEPAKLPRVFVGGPMIYGLIRDLIAIPEWGNPTGYDLSIMRTEEQGRYYSVQPVPPVKPISEQEQGILDAANIDLIAVCTGKHDTPQSKLDASGDDKDPFADD